MLSARCEKRTKIIRASALTPGLQMSLVHPSIVQLLPYFAAQKSYIPFEKITSSSVQLWLLDWARLPRGCWQSQQQIYVNQKFGTAQVQLTFIKSNVVVGTSSAWMTNGIQGGTVNRISKNKSSILKNSEFAEIRLSKAYRQSLLCKPCETIASNIRIPYVNKIHGPVCVFLNDGLWLVQHYTRLAHGKVSKSVLDKKYIYEGDFQIL